MTMPDRGRGGCTFQIAARLGRRPEGLFFGSPPERGRSARTPPEPPPGHAMTREATGMTKTIAAVVLWSLSFAWAVPAGAAGPAAEDYEDEYADEADAATVADPLEPFNREMYLLNDFLYFYVLKPAARVVKAVVPVEIRTGVRNMFDNVRFPVRFVNSLLQGKWEKAGDEFAKFFLNTTVGFLGFADVASIYPGLNQSPEDLGQTFAVWGAGDGFYLMLPVLGPMTFRDGLGKVGDTLLDPVFWAVDGTGTSVALRAGETVNDTSFRIGDYEALKQAALDPYTAIRNGYVQSRARRISE
jgi:phospholipid-binding lipoprotein MlaA